MDGQTHPAVTSPEHWDYDIAADFARAVDQMKVGDWRSPNNYPEQFNRNVEKPLMPRAKGLFLHRDRSFFLDLQDHPLHVGKDQTRSGRCSSVLTRCARSGRRLLSTA